MSFIKLRITRILAVLASWSILYKPFADAINRKYHQHALEPVDEQTPVGLRASVDKNKKLDRGESLLDRAATDCGPLKVFVLAGQSNMVGQGDMQHLISLIDNPATHDEYVQLWNDTSNDWAEREDVYIKFGQRAGKLKAGFGDIDRFGPELGFGWKVGDFYNAGVVGCQNRILLLKMAQGGRDLAIDFRPPSSGKGDFTFDELQLPTRKQNFTEDDVGWLYRQTMREIRNILSPSNLTTIVPDFDVNRGYDLSGFVWLHGWNDLQLKKAREYKKNLINLIRDVRVDLNSPNLPFVVGQMGQHGVHYHDYARDRVMAIRRAQIRVTLLPEFRDNTKYVSTAEFVDDSGSVFNGECHYFGRADAFYSIGQALGDGVLSILEGANVF